MALEYYDSFFRHYPTQFAEQTGRYMKLRRAAFVGECSFLGTKWQANGFAPTSSGDSCARRLNLLSMKERKNHFASTDLGVGRGP